MIFLEFEHFSDPKLKDKFVSEATHLGLDKILTKHKKELRVVFHKCKLEDVFLVMIVGNFDKILIELGKSHKFPRGFPILWRVGKEMRYFGFYPKFDNDDRQSADDDSEFSSIKNLFFFKKWSGFLSQLLVFQIDDTPYWTVTSKNSAEGKSPFVQDAKRLFEPFLTKTLIQDMLQNKLHLCAEIMSKNDQTHGSRVSKETPIVTAIGFPGCDKGERSFVSFYDHLELVEFCVMHGLPCDSAVVISDAKEAIGFIKQLSAKRDFMTNSKLDEIVDKKYIVKGTVSHEDILGDTLEGLVLMSGNLVKKYKFPNYTIRTMLFREVFQQFVYSPTLVQSAKRFVEHWCVSQEGKDYWYQFALQGFIDKATFVSYDPSIGDHIQIADKVVPSYRTESAFHSLVSCTCTGSIIIVIGPIGSGKSTLANHIVKLGENFKHVDGDELDLGSETVMKLGKERGDYTRWQVCKTLMEGKIPVLSTGGGVLFSQGKVQKYILSEEIYKTLGIVPEIIVLIPRGDEMKKLERTFVPDYEDETLVRNVILKRLKEGTWKRDTKFKKDEDFIKFIVNKSKENLKFATGLLEIASQAYSCPPVEKFSELPWKPSSGKVIQEGKFGQIRILVQVDGDKIGHITFDYSSKHDLSYSLDKLNSIAKIGKILQGELVRLEKILLAIPDEKFHQDGSTHVTLDCGPHQPKDMKEIAIGLKKGGTVLGYDVRKCVKTKCEIKVLAVFGL